MPGKRVLLLALALCLGTASAMIPLGARATPLMAPRTHRRSNVNTHAISLKPEGLAMAIPGESVGEEIVVGGMLNFLTLFNLCITARVILSWFPQAQGMGFLRPIFLVSDPYLNAFRRLNLTVGGLDLSVLPAFLLLSFATNAVASLGAELPLGAALREGPRGWWMRPAGRASSGAKDMPAEGPQPQGHRRLVAFGHWGQ